MSDQQITNSQCPHCNRDRVRVPCDIVQTTRWMNGCMVLETIATGWADVCPCCDDNRVMRTDSGSGSARVA
jgi:hypothetical protein